MPRVETGFQIEGGELLFRNFRGEERKFNPAGMRNFCVILDPSVADQMRKDGWNVKSLQPREEGDSERFFVKVNVSWKNRPPQIVMIGNLTKTRRYLDEESVGMLDHLEIENVDFNVNPYNNDMGTVTAYLNNMYVTIVEDALDVKYSQAGAEEG